MSLAEDVRLLTEQVAMTDLAVEGEEWADLDQGLVCYALIETAARDLSRIRDELARKLAGSFPEGEKRIVVEGAGVFEKHRKADRKGWDKEDLLRAVLDTRIVDPDTGEVLDPNDLDKVLRVWNLGAPRITALRERGIDPEEFCTVEYGALTLQFTGEIATTSEAA